MPTTFCDTFSALMLETISMAAQLSHKSTTRSPSAFLILFEDGSASDQSQQWKLHGKTDQRNTQREFDLDAQQPPQSDDLERQRPHQVYYSMQADDDVRVESVQRDGCPINQEGVRHDDQIDHAGDIEDLIHVAGFASQTDAQVD